MIWPSEGLHEDSHPLLAWSPSEVVSLSWLYMVWCREGDASPLTSADTHPCSLHSLSGSGSSSATPLPVAGSSPWWGVGLSDAWTTRTIGARTRLAFPWQLGQDAPNCGLGWSHCAALGTSSERDLWTNHCTFKRQKFLRKNSEISMWTQE